MESKYSVLSDKIIVEYMKNNKIIIEPFDIKNLNTSSYDVTLGPYYYRETKTRLSYYNMYSKDHVTKVWGKPQEATVMKHKFENIDPSEKIILIKPGETILCHTNEFIGGRNSVTTMMKSRSSCGRNFLEICKCSGWGDCNYYNRWTMEITNNSRYHTIPLVVGRRIAQIVFMETDGVLNNTYDHDGKYQTCNDLKQLKINWKPDDMLPKMYLDYENKN